MTHLAARNPHYATGTHPLFGLFRNYYPGHLVMAERLATQIDAHRCVHWNTGDVADWLNLTFTRIESETLKAIINQLKQQRLNLHEARKKTKHAAEKDQMAACIELLDKLIPKIQQITIN